MDVHRFNLLQFERRWLALRRLLRTVEQERGLGAALEALVAQHHDLGFILDDPVMERYCFRSDADPARFLKAQFNPRRAKRLESGALQTPPGDFASVNDSCFLCRQNTMWRERGVELGYDLQGSRRGYVAFPNPFPVEPNHVVVARSEHIAQAWKHESPAGGEDALRALLGDLLAFAARLPGWIGIYNGAGAGASIVGHRHFQFFGRGRKPHRFPLVCAAGAPSSNGWKIVPSYPVAALCIEGTAEEVCVRAADVVERWFATGPERSLNLVATGIAATASTHVRLFFVPRRCDLERAKGFSGLVGAIEVLGELVYTTPDEYELLKMDRIDYDVAARVLAGVEPPEARAFLTRVVG